MDTHVTDGLSAGLEAFFDNDSGSFKSCAGFLNDVDQTKKCTAIGKKIIDRVRDLPVREISWKGSHRKLSCG